MNDFTKTMFLGELFSSEQRGRHRKSRPLFRSRLTNIRFTWTTGAAIVLVAVFLGGLTAVIYGWRMPYAHVGDTQATQNALEQQWNDQPDIVSDPTSPTPKPTKKPSGPAGPGFTPVAKLTIPSLNNIHWFVIDGVDLSDLRQAPGHYPNSADPGQVGNFSVAGHREPRMFWDLDQVKVGQQIIVETHTRRYVYTVRANIVTLPNATIEVSPVPPGYEKGDRLLTLTTCEPKTGNKHRRIVHAELTSSQSL